MSTILKRKGDYHNLIAYKRSVVIYDVAFSFTRHFLQKSGRAIDQVLRAVRSGKQNIVEGNRAATTSTETEIKLTDVAKTSLEELLIDYQDYLRTRNRLLWGGFDPRYEKTHAYAASELIFDRCHSLLHRYNDETLANLYITLTHQTSFLPCRLLEKQEENFLKKRGTKERVCQARLSIKDKRFSGRDKKAERTERAKRVGKIERNEKAERNEKVGRNGKVEGSEKAGGDERAGKSGKARKNGKAGRSEKIRRDEKIGRDKKAGRAERAGRNERVV